MELRGLANQLIGKLLGFVNLDFLQALSSEYRGRHFLPHSDVRWCHAYTQGHVDGGGRLNTDSLPHHATMIGLQCDPHVQIPWNALALTPHCEHAIGAKNSFLASCISKRLLKSISYAQM